jgi:hypothetical protein
MRKRRLNGAAYVNEVYYTVTDANTPIPKNISPEHYRDHIRASAISDEVARGRGYYTARRKADVPECFKGYQRRLGLVVPLYSPDGQTTRYQLRPNNPRHNGPKYETPTGSRCIVDVHPRMQGNLAVRDTSRTLWVTEGAKCGDALTSSGRCTAVLAGVWNFAVPKTNSRELLPCWNHIALAGRKVIVAYDHDAQINANVQDALGRLVDRLSGRGANVLVVYIPAVNGDTKAGVDDYLAAGGDLDELEATAAPYVPLDIARERLSKDEKLARLVRACWRRVEEMPASKRGECSQRAVMRDLVKTAERIGKVTPDGLLVVRSCLDGAAGARMGTWAWWKAIKALEEAGELRRAKWGPNHDRGGAYLLTPGGTPGGEGAQNAHIYRGRVAQRGRQGGKEGESEEGIRLSNGGDDHSVCETRGSDPDEVPVLRWPKVVHTWARREGRRVVVDSDYIARIGKQGEEIIRYLLKHGRTPAADLLSEFGSKTTRLRDFKRRRLKPLMDRGILTHSEAGEDLAPNWREALERAREESDEIIDNRLQARKVARRKQERREYYERVRSGAGEDIKPDTTPDLQGKEHTREALQDNRLEWERQRIEEQRTKVGVTCEVFVHETLERLGRVRFGLLREMWVEKDGKPDHVRFAIKKLGYRLQRLPEFGNALFVFPAPSSKATLEPDQEPAPVVELRGEALPEPAKLAEPPSRREDSPRIVNGIHVHGALCECEWCADPPAPRYATAFASQGWVA